MKIFQKVLIIFIIFILLFSSNYGVMAVTYEAIKDAVTKTDNKELDMPEEKQASEAEIEDLEKTGQVINNDNNNPLEEMQIEDKTDVNEALKEENSEEKIEAEEKQDNSLVENEENKDKEDSFQTSQKDVIQENSKIDETKEDIENNNDDNIIDNENSRNIEEVQEIEDDDPLKESRGANMVNNTSSKLRKARASKPVEDIATLIERFETEGTTAIGIDVSKHQGEIDWKQVASSGVKFAMIRCGYRGFSGEGKLVEDTYFRKNVEGAINNGIYVGVYFYSMAINEQEAIDEANYTLELIKDYDIKYPVCYDFETFEDIVSEAGTPYRTNGLTQEQMNKNAEVFLSQIASKGYKACIYGSSYPLRDIWDMSRFENYEVWVAHYYVSKPSYYTGKYNMWQYSETGRVPGINTNVDIDIDYTYYFKYHDVDITEYLFDSKYYSDRYKDLKLLYGENNANALKEHYLKNGIKEGRSASPAFDPKYYLNKYPDLKNSLGEANYEGAYNHFINIGIKEGRSGSKYFDVNYYLTNNPDLKKIYYSSKTLALMHFSLYGANEGRRGSQEFSAIDYRNKVNEFYRYNLGTEYKRYMALDSGGTPIINDPINITSYLFDSEYYSDRYKDLKLAFGNNTVLLKDHYLKNGIKEGRSASPVFDPKYYLNKYSDLAKAFGAKNYEAAYNHFINNGINEGRQGSKYFDCKYYYSTHTDLHKNYAQNYSKYLMHFANYGAKEGRQGSKEFYAKGYSKTVNEFYKYHLGTNYKRYMALDAGGTPVINDPIDITSYLFDSSYYVDRYRNLREVFGNNEVALKDHYLTFGIKEGRTASPVFDPKYYLEKYPDLTKAFGAKNYEAAYNHFINNGIKEGRQGSKYFNVKYYYSKYKDLEKEYGQNNSKLLMHFAVCGASEGRQGSEEFNSREYRNNSNEFYKTKLGTDYKKFIVLNAGGTPIINDPIDITSYLFDSSFYANKYSDLKAIFGNDEKALKEHYLKFGIKEGRVASPCFDAKYYLEKYPDLAKAFGTKNYEAAYNHFINNGINEGRSGSKEFDVKYYYSTYKDLEREFGQNYSKLLMHFAVCGFKEGRKGNI